ncbi:ABC transporter ATP-binding protein [Thiospirochaeta perfilievii]|uniref:ABC transporter ATP-binding protein n=1 Tax=Thiospirochaeta perfilievii TaxID=252967 RepID=A0A5C1Q9B8_9SPIO|nr:ABC transporter ATP-binding protein [Thiospirochaeta perfilievii]QEN04635.1 ABC transporter ATP-binding protein [Thiospirochaeta perfilievii]
MIKIRNLVKDYQSGETVVKALRDISVDINSGEFTAIAGPSGSGKTTMLNIIGCIDSLDSGTVTIGEQEVSTMAKIEKSFFRRENLGFIFQSYNLIPVLTAYENVAFPLNLLGLLEKEIKPRVMKMLKEVGLEGMEHRVPSQLSGGQQQRVSIARALIKNPQLVLADEPTANLDSNTGRDILDLMLKMNKIHKTTFIFSTHDQMVMDCAKRLLYLHDGEVIKDERRE